MKCSVCIFARSAKWKLKTPAVTYFFSERNLLVTLWSRPNAICHIMCQLIGLTAFCYAHHLVILPIFEFRIESGYILLQKFTIMREVVICCNLIKTFALIVNKRSSKYFQRNFFRKKFNARISIRERWKMEISVVCCRIYVPLVWARADGFVKGNKPCRHSEWNRISLP